MSEEIKRLVVDTLDSCKRNLFKNEYYEAFYPTLKDAVIKLVSTQVEAERERCAKLAEETYGDGVMLNHLAVRDIIAKAIRNKPTNKGE